MLRVPDISYFPESPAERDFTVAAVTPGAYWLVQDTTWFDLPSPEDEFQLIWGNLVTEETIYAIAGDFEGPSGMHATVAAALGEMQETGNGDDRLWIVFADIPDYYPVPGSGYQRLKNWLYTWPDDFDGDPLTGNNHDIFYVNLSPYKNQTGGSWNEIRQSIYTWSVASGLGQIFRMAANPQEEKWVIRGLGAYTQYLCYGITSALNGALGIEGYMEDFAKAGGVELPSWWSGKYSKDFSANLGGAFLWFQYLAQRYGSGVISAVTQSDLSGMLSIALSIDPTVSPEMAMETVAYPIYEDWIITNLISPFAESYQNGDYHYKFLDGTGYEFSIIDKPASFLGEFDEYPFPTWIAPVTYGISAQEFAAQYADFSGDYVSGGNTTVHFNGMYNQNNGSGANIDGRWTVFRIVLEDSNLVSVDSLEFDELFNGTFQLSGDRTFIALMCNNPGGTANIRYTLSQDIAPRSVFTAVTQNPMHPGLFQVYTSLFREDTGIPCGFDWTGPHVTLSLMNTSGLPDSSATIKMAFLEQTLWFGGMEAWAEGVYQLVSSGYDSLGRTWSDTLNSAVAYTDQDSLCLSAGSASYHLDGGMFSPGTVAFITETGMPPGGEAAPRIISGPVSILPAGGLLEFTSDDAEGAVYRYTAGEWIRHECYRVDHKVSAFVEHSGIYMLGGAELDPALEVAPEPCLQGVSPNPFTSTLSVSFSTPGPRLVNIGMYDLSGRLSARLFSGYLTGGAKNFSWSGTVPAGMYFVVLESGDSIDVMRVVKL